MAAHSPRLLVGEGRSHRSNSKGKPTACAFTNFADSWNYPLSAVCRSDSHSTFTRPDLSRLQQSGWTQVDPLTAASNPDAYQAFIRDSAAEFMVAKNLYVRSRGGWFSDRSICYLATGRPVLSQDTGLADLLPVGHGLVTFDTLQQAAEGAKSIAADYPRHCRAARSIAEDHFNSNRVLSRLVDRLGL